MGRFRELVAGRYAAAWRLQMRETAGAGVI